MITIHKKMGFDGKQGIFLLTPPQVLLIVVLAGLLLLLVSTCIKFTNGPSSTTALKQHLLLLQSKFAASETVNPELERQQIEKLQNKIKTSSDHLTISADNDLKQLFASNCEYIQSAMIDVNLVNR